MQILKPAPIEEKPLKLVELPKPIPTNKQVLIKVSACGVCRTDLHVTEGDIKKGNYPIVPGHQIVGSIEELGNNCTRFKEGDRVGVAWLGTTCQTCPFCKRNQENLCSQSGYTGYQLPGGYAEYTVAHEEYIYPIPDLFTDEEATPLLCSGIIGYRAFKRSQIQKGQKLGIYGFGSSAHIIMQIASAWKCPVYVATRDEKHQNLAQKLGACYVGQGQEVLPEKMQSIIVFAPAGELVPLALKSLESGGTCALAGIHMSDIPQMRYEECLFHEKNLVSVEANTRLDGNELLKIAAEIPIKPTIQTYPLEKANEVLLKLKNDSIEGTAVLKL